MVSSSKSQQSILFFLPALLFFVSGCSSLIFEMIWTRRLALVMGSTIYAASATVASFMLGLGVGAYLADRLVRKSDNLFRLFGILELTAGLGGLLVTLLIPLYGKVICGLFSAFGSIPAFMVIARVVLIFLTLLIPCMAMGASLPVLSHLYTHRFGASFSRGLAFLYAINTLGAATGAFLTDFFIVEHLGITGTAILAALINLGVALIAFIFSPAARASIQENIPPGGQVSPLLTLVFLACGFCGMVLQISWTRMLVFFNGCDVFAFSTTLVTYLVGIVVGSLVMARFAAGFSDNRSALGYIFGLTGCVAFLSIFSASLIIPLKTMLVEGNRIPYHLAMFLADSVVILPATVLLGLLFPFAAKMLYDELGRAVISVGRAYSINTVGSVTGALATGFIFLPFFGLQCSLVIVSLIALSVSMILLIFRKPISYTYITIYGIFYLLIGANIFFIPSDTILKILYSSNFAGIVYHGEDHYGSVALIRQWDNALKQPVENLIVDGFNMAGNSITARRYTTMLSAVPLFLHKKPENVLVICLGLGNSLNAALKTDTTSSVDCVEISRKVIEAVTLMPGGKHLLSSPKLSIYINDGRNYLLTTSKRYDVITAEPPPPTHSGIVNLYSREYYQLCRKALKPGGITAQWLPVWEMSPFESATIIRAFQSVFPYTYLWEAEGPQLCLVGSNLPLSLDYASLKKRIARNREVFQPIGLDNAELFAAEIIAGPSHLKTYTARVPPLTDDRPYIQYSRSCWSPDYRFFFFTPREKEMDILLSKEPLEREAQEREIARGLKAVRGIRYYLFASAVEPGVNNLSRYENAARSLELYPFNPYFTVVTLSTETILEHYREGKPGVPSDPEAAYQCARIFFLHSRLAEAGEFMDKALNIIPRSPRRSFFIAFRGLIAERQGKDKQARTYYRKALESGTLDDSMIDFVRKKISL